MTWKRVATAMVLVPLAVGLALWGSTAIVAIAVALVTLLALFEYFALAEAIGQAGTGTCEKIDWRDFPGGRKCIRISRASFIRVLNDKFLNADSAEIGNLDFFTRSRQERFLIVYP